MAVTCSYAGFAIASTNTDEKVSSWTNLVSCYTSGRYTNCNGGGTASIAKPSAHIVVMML